jgi:hypothetical protein
LQPREPDDSVGYSILIYRLTRDDLDKALNVAPPTLAPLAPPPGEASQEKRR